MAKYKVFFHSGDMLASPQPFLLERLEWLESAKPATHRVEEDDDGYAHTLTWPDNSGCTFLCEDPTLRGVDIAQLYGTVRSDLEVAEFEHCGWVLH